MTSKCKSGSTRRARRDTSRSPIAKQARQPAIGANHSGHSNLPSLDSFADATSVSRMFTGNSYTTSSTSTTAGRARRHLQLVARGSGCRPYVTEEGPSPFVCPHCARTLPSRNALKGHVMRGHELKQVVQCPHCAKAFTRPAQLRKHIASCHDERTMEFYCEKCTFKHRDVEVFNQHVHLHNVCKFCRNEFAQLSRHLPKCPYRPPCL